LFAGWDRGGDGYIGLPVEKWKAKRFGLG